METQIDSPSGKTPSQGTFGVVSVDLGSFRKNRSIAGRGRVTQLVWATAGLGLLRNSWIPGSGWRVALLRIFGARIGAGVIMKPGVRVKFPWKLKVGKHSWIGEDCWIDNLAEVSIGSNVCLSQGCYLCTGNHDWTDPSFSMRASPIVVEDGAWVASRSTLGPGVRLGINAIAAMGSVIRTTVPAGEIHGGNPASRQGIRVLAADRQNDCVRPAGGEAAHAFRR